MAEERDSESKREKKENSIPGNRVGIFVHFGRKHGASDLSFGIFMIHHTARYKGYGSNATE